MATILLGAVGGAIGASFGGAVLGMSGAVIGRAVGATLGRVIDQRLMGAGSTAIETGRVDRLRLTGASEGAPVARVWGRVRVAGQVIWASRFVEDRRTRRMGGKGGPKVVEHSYSVSLAIALCEGEIVGVGRVWADGAELSPETLGLRVYPGSEDQLPDPAIAAVEGAGNTPAYRGIAYVVIEDLDLTPFGNRVPQFTFEVLRSAAGAEVPDLMQGVRAVAMIPGTGEFSLMTEIVPGAQQMQGLEDLSGGGAVDALKVGMASTAPANAHGLDRRTDFTLALEQLTRELPRCGSVLLVVSWFGDDLRCGACRVRPKVENIADAPWRPWRVCGVERAAAQEVARLDGRVVYGGTPSDTAVLQAIAALKEAGQKAVFYPFVLMEQLQDNGLPNPWTGETGQPVLPWRGRITASVAPGRPGTPDRTAAVDAEVAAFFGAVQPEDFALADGQVVYSGPPDDWGYRRFILHYAWLSKLAGGIDAFCVGSEMRGLTQLRGAGDSFPAVEALRALAADVRAILGPEVKISYAADWSEYFGYLSPEGDRHFHLDPFWADPNVDFVGIDNYMPLSDWRDGAAHADAGWGAIHDLGYLRANVAGGELFDWYYASDADRAAQLRSPIEDGAHGEPWVWRAKDLRGWWENPHHPRVNGVRSAAPTAWVPRSKPFWFTELGCAAVDKGTNAPNLFLDPKSSESFMPPFSNGWRDDAIQQQYHRAMIAHWADPANNPVSPQYGGPMVDMGRAHVWAWDARPFPAFPARLDVWSDGENWMRGHWITGRTAAQPLASVVAEICRLAGVEAVDASGLHGVVRGLSVASTDPARAVLQVLMLTYGFEAAEREGRLVFRMRGARPAASLSEAAVAVRDGGDIQMTRAAEPEVAGRVRIVHLEAEADFDVRAVEAVRADDPGVTVSQSELPLVLTAAEAQGVAERWLAEAQVARDTLRLSLPLSTRLGAGDVFALERPEGGRLWRIDRVEGAGALEIAAVRVEPGVYVPTHQPGDRPRQRPQVPHTSLPPLFLDLPLLTGAEVPHAPHLALCGSGAEGTMAVFDALPGEGFRLNRRLEARAAMGLTLSPLARARPGCWDRGAPLTVRIAGAALQSVGEAALLAGANAMAIGDGSPSGWEILQFRTAELVAPGVWELSMRLRGQLGTEADMPDVWPAGSIVVLLDDALEQVELPSAARGLVRRWRVGPADRPHDDPAYVEIEHAFEGIGLRPFAPAHLRASRDAGGALGLSWIRRTRIDGDGWIGPDVPLGEAAERYVVRVHKGTDLVREAEVAEPGWSYAAAQQSADGAVPPFRVAVAQMSQAFGPGPFTEIEIHD